jgi:hypothetical protein
MGKLIYSVIASLDGNNLPVVCAQIVSKNHQEYQNISNNIEIYRNQKLFENLRYTFFRRFLHEANWSRELDSDDDQLIWPVSELLII